MMNTQRVDTLSSDSGWLLRIRQNDATALASIMDKYYPDLYHYAAGLTLDTAIIKDSIQETFLDLWKKRKTADAISTLRPWLLHTVKARILRTISCKDSSKDSSTSLRNMAH